MSHPEKLHRSVGPLVALTALAAAMGCTSLLGIGGDFRVAAGGGTSSSSGSSSTASGGGGGDSGTSSTTGGGGPGGGATMTVSGSNIPIYVLPTSETPQPVNMKSGHFVGAVVPLPGGAFKEIAGSGLSNGTFTIKDVPVGGYYLDLDSDYYWLQNDGTMPELGPYITGRTTQKGATAPTNTTFEVTGMTPWVQADDVQAISFEANLATCCAQLNDDVTTYDPTISWRDQVYPFPGHLLKVADTLWLTQNTAKTTSGGLAYESADNFATITDVNMPDGSSPTLSGSFAPIPTQKNATLSLSLSSFAAKMTEVHPDAAANTAFYAVDILHTAPSHGDIAPSLDMLLVIFNPGDPDVSNEVMTFGNPFPPQYTEVCYVNYRYLVPYQLPNATLHHVGGAFAHYDTRAGCETSTITLDLSPPLDATVDGKPFQMDANLASKTPVLTWSAPDTGTADTYVVDVRRLYVLNGATATSAVATIETDQTSATIPPHLLESGNVYFFVITAFKAVSFNYQQYPTRAGLPSSSAATFSAKFTVP